MQKDAPKDAIPLKCDVGSKGGCHIECAIWGDNYCVNGFPIARKCSFGYTSKCGKGKCALYGTRHCIGGVIQHILTPKENGLILDIKGASTADNIPLITWIQSETANQVFIIERQPDLTYKIIASNSKKTLTVNSNGKIVQQSWNEGDNQRWLISGNDDRIVKIINIGTGKIIDIPNNSKAVGTEIWVYPDNGTQAQRFRLARP